MAVVSTRYAKALLDSASSKKQRDSFKNDLQTISELYNTNAEFKETLISPQVTNEIKTEIISDITKPDKIFTKFIELLLEENRINLIGDIYHKYTQMTDKIDKKIKLQIITATKLSKEDADAIALKYQKLYDANETEYETLIDKTIMGGVKVIVGDKVYDDTVATKLNSIFEN